jgi:hypothetical protein
MIDLTGKMSPDGILSWDAPEGKWTVLRIGHVNTGMKNGPAPPEATGWECNKLSPAGTQANFDGYIGRLMNDNVRLKEGLLKRGNDICIPLNFFIVIWVAVGWLI